MSDGGAGGFDGGGSYDSGSNHSSSSHDYGSSHTPSHTPSHDSTPHTHHTTNHNDGTSTSYDDSWGHPHSTGEYPPIFPAQPVEESERQYQAQRKPQPIPRMESTQLRPVNDLPLNASLPRKRTPWYKRMFGIK